MGSVSWLRTSRTACVAWPFTCNCAMVRLAVAHIAIEGTPIGMTYELDSEYLGLWEGGADLNGEVGAAADGIFLVDVVLVLLDVLDLCVC